MSDNKKKRIDKGSVPQKPLKTRKDLIELIKVSVPQKLPKARKDLIELIKVSVPTANYGYSPPGPPKLPFKNFKMP